MDKETKESVLKLIERYKKRSNEWGESPERCESYIVVVLDLQELIKDSEKRANYA